jgi:phage tail sheath protein FI
MPVQLSYPGVYIEEIPSGVRTIAGVATSIAAFVGWAAKGPSDRAELILSWLDYERKFGGLNPQSLLSYSVYQFFANGGRQAYVIRLVANASHAAVSAAFVADKGLSISAKNEGVWSRQYGVTIKMRTDAENTDRFTLSVVLLQSSGPGVVVESFDNLSANQNDSRFVKNVVNAGSSIIDVTAVTSPPAKPNLSLWQEEAMAPS